LTGYVLSAKEHALLNYPCVKEEYKGLSEWKKSEGSFEAVLGAAISSKYMLKFIGR